MVTQKQVSDWYNKKHKKKGNNAWRPIAAYDQFLDYLRVKSGKKLLDVGCGVGSLLKLANQRGLITYGIDISSQGVKLSKKNSPESIIKVERGEKLKFKDKTFDYVTCLGVLEHFLDIDKGLSEFYRVGKKTATYCVMVPNARFIYWLVTGKKGTDQQDINENLLTKNEWEEKFAKAGYKVKKVYQDTWHKDKIKILSSNNPIGIIKNIVVKCAWSIVPLPFTYQFVFLLEKNNGKR